MISDQDLKNLILDKEETSPRGCASTFIDIDGEWGFKTFSFLPDAIHAHEMQTLAYHALGLAPKPGKLIRNPLGS